jgi:hypothetical protein
MALPQQHAGLVPLLGQLPLPLDAMLLVACLPCMSLGTRPAVTPAARIVTWPDAARIKSKPKHLSFMYACTSACCGNVQPQKQARLYNYSASCRCRLLPGIKAAFLRAC